MKTKTSRVDPLDIHIRETYSSRIRRNIYTGKIELDGKPIGKLDINTIWLKACKAVGRVSVKLIAYFLNRYAVDYIPVTHDRNGVRIKYGVNNGRPILILPIIQGNDLCEPCPFCTRRHSHTIEGPRAVHCDSVTRSNKNKNFNVIKHPDNTLLFKSDGYLIKIIESKSKINLV